MRGNRLRGTVGARQRSSAIWPGSVRVFTAAESGCTGSRAGASRLPARRACGAGAPVPALAAQQIRRCLSRLSAPWVVKGSVRPARARAGGCWGRRARPITRAGMSPSGTTAGLPVKPRVLRWSRKVLRTCAWPGESSQGGLTASLPGRGTSRASAGGNGPLPRTPPEDPMTRHPITRTLLLLLRDARGRFTRSVPPSPRSSPVRVSDVAPAGAGRRPARPVLTAGE